jgi:hypothetical protein
MTSCFLARTLMTTYGRESQTCSVCGAHVECTVLKSVSTFGSSDLDLRPSEMQRSTMDNWLHECTECGYINSNLSQPIEDAKRTIESDPFNAIRSDSQLPALACRFALYSLLRKHDPEAAGVALLRAAWVCDDRHYAEQAKSFRGQAADILLTLQPFADEEENWTLATILVDVLRRAERFGEAKELATSLQSFKSVNARKIVVSALQFQCRLCDDCDTDCYTVADCEPAG